MGQKIIGLVGPLELATAFSAVGYRIVGGATFQEAAKNIRAEAEKVGKQPDLILVVDEPAAGIVPWVESQAMRTEVRIIPSIDGAMRGHGLAVSVPTTVADLLASVGLEATGAGANARIDTGGVVTSTVAPEGRVVELAQAQPAAPVSVAITIPQPEPAPAPAPQMPEPAEQVPDLSQIDPDFVPRPIPTLSDEDEDEETVEERPQTPTPDSAPEPTFVPPNGSDAPVGGGNQPAWLNPQPQAEPVAPPVHQPAPAAAPVEPAAPVFTPAPPVHQPPFIPAPASSPAPAPEPTPAPQQAYIPPAPPVHQPPFIPAPAPQPVQPYAAPVQPASEQSQTHLNPWQGAPISATDFRDQRSQFARERIEATRDAQLIISWAGKGGAGKSSLSLITAETAGEAGLRVLLIDANRGQSSIRRNLKVTREQFPSINDVPRQGARASVVSADLINQRRPAARGTLHFDLLLAPPDDLAGPVLTPASSYMQALSELRSEYDLIVIDTQILEAEGDMTDIWHVFLVPLLRGDAWGLGVFDDSSEGLDLLESRVTMLTEQFGISNARMIVIANKWEQFTDDDAAMISQMFAGRATFIGSSDLDMAFHDRLGTGFVFTAATGIAPVVRLLLHKVTGRREFEPVAAAGGKRTPFRLFGRKSK